MNAITRCLSLVALGSVATIAVPANAQDFQIDSPRRIQRDRDGHADEFRQQNRYPNANYVLPSDGIDRFDGSYFVRDNQYYYVPRTSSDRRRQPDPRRYERGSFSHVDDLVTRLEKLANDFCLDLHYNYSHNRGFRETYAEAYHILKASQLLHNLEHEGNREGIRSRLRGLDGLFHHIQEDVRGWNRHEHRRIGRTSTQEKIELIESTIHHLMYDTGVPHARIGHDHDRRGPDPRQFDQAPPPR